MHSIFLDITQLDETNAGELAALIKVRNNTTAQCTKHLLTDPSPHAESVVGSNPLHVNSTPGINASHRMVLANGLQDGSVINFTLEEPDHNSFVVHCRIIYYRQDGCAEDAVSAIKATRSSAMA